MTEKGVDGRHRDQVWHRPLLSSLARLRGVSGWGAVVCSLSVETSVSYLRVLECTACGGEFDAGMVHGVCPRCQKVLFARYDLAAARSAITPDDFLRRGWDMWRYRELLPVRHHANIVTLG